LFRLREGLGEEGWEGWKKWGAEIREERKKIAGRHEHGGGGKNLTISTLPKEGKAHTKREGREILDRSA